MASAARPWAPQGPWVAASSPQDEEGGGREAVVQHGVEVVQEREADHAKGCL